MILDAILTCPNCQHQYKETMPENTYQSNYRCPSCKSVIKAKKGECCVYCCYGDIVCPSTQIAGGACCG